MALMPSILNMLFIVTYLHIGYVTSQNLPYYKRIKMLWVAWLVFNLYCNNMKKRRKSDFILAVYVVALFTTPKRL